ncbi:MAG: TVP38/TMEM64 family protein [Elusimicrobiota bacterium]
MKLNNSSWLKLFFGVFLCGSVLVLLKLSPWGQYFTLPFLIEWVEHAKGNPMLTALFLVFFVFGVLWLPITPFPIIGGVLFNFWVAIPLNVLCATLGACMAFGISRYFGRDVIESFLKGKFKTFDQITAAEGFKTVFLLRFIGIPPFIVSNYALGLSGISLKKYFLGTLLGIIPWMVLITALSHSLWQAVLISGQKGFFQAWVALRPLFFVSLSIGLISLIYLIYKNKKQKKTS